MECYSPAEGSKKVKKKKRIESWNVDLSKANRSYSQVKNIGVLFFSTQGHKKWVPTHTHYSFYYFWLDYTPSV